MISDLQLTCLYLYTIVLISDPTEWFVACKEREFNFEASG